MSTESTPLTERHLAYVAAHAAGEDAFLRELRRDAAAAGLPAISIAPEQAALLQVLLRVAGAREVLEVGTLGGYSAIAMARALPSGGRVRTIEIEPGHAEFARARVAASDVAGRVEVLLGDGRDLLPGIDAASADACFIDADKEGYAAYLEQCMRILRPGGLVLVDNAFAFGRLLEDPPGDDVRTIRAFNDAVAARTDLQAVIVPLGDGCWVGAKER